jgi:hypothetical protein
MRLSWSSYSRRTERKISQTSTGRIRSRFSSMRMEMRSYLRRRSPRNPLNTGLLSHKDHQRRECSNPIRRAEVWQLQSATTSDRG